MSVKIGYIENTQAQLLTVDDIIKQDITEQPNVDVAQGTFGFSTVQRRPLHAVINLETDWFSENNYGLFRKYMNNRNYPQKIFLAHPASTAQYVDYAGITSPSTTQIAYWVKDDNASRTPTQILATGTEFDNAAYVNPSTQWYAYNSIKFKGPSESAYTMYLLNTTKFYTHLLFKFKISSWIALFSTTAEALNAIRRLTLFCANLEMVGDNNNYGYTINVWDTANSLWLEIARKYYHVTAGVALGLRCQQTNAIRPQEGFGSYSDLVDGSGYVTIRISNVNPSSGNFNTRLNYIALLINGYGVAWTNPDNFTYRDALTISGFTGTVELTEL